jgi:hypothetical protein
MVIEEGPFFILLFSLYSFVCSSLLLFAHSIPTLRDVAIEEEEKERKRRVGEVAEEGGEAHLRGPSAVRRDRGVVPSSASRPRASREGRMLAFQRQLHAEAQQFVRHCRRVAEERSAIVESATRDVEAMAVACGASSVYKYGSVATGTAIPSSDLDLMIVSESLDTIDLELFAAKIAAKAWALDVKCVAHTMFPVVKLKYALLAPVDAAGAAAGGGGGAAKVVARLDVDISFTHSSAVGGRGGGSSCTSTGRGPGTAFVRVLLARHPALLPLVLVLKQLLAQRGLNDPYTGGLTSYGLLLLVTSVLQQRGVSAAMAANGVHLGALLMDFLQIFGNEFQAEHTVVVLRADVEHLERRAVPDSSGGVEQLLAGLDALTIEDPLDPSNNVGRSCFNVKSVQRCFADSLAALVFHSQIGEEEGAEGGGGSEGGAEGGGKGKVGIDGDGAGALMRVMKGAKKRDQRAEPRPESAAASPLADTVARV